MGKSKFLIPALVVGGLAFYLFSRKGGSGGGHDAAASGQLPPTHVGPGEQVTAGSYRIISAQRPGMQYVPASGAAGAALTFASPSGGVFTRNVVNQGGQLLAEIKVG